MHSLARTACALGAALAAVSCDDRPHPWAGNDGPAAVLTAPPPGPSGEPIGQADDGPATTSAPAAPAGDASAPPVADPTAAPEPVPASTHEITPGGGWVSCAEGLTLSGDPLKDVTRLGLVCGPANGMRRKTQQAIVGVVGEHEPPVVAQLRVARGACYRIFAVADAQVSELDVTVRSSRDVAVAGDHTPGRRAIVQADRPFCTFADDIFSLEVSALHGNGRFAAEVWSLGERRRKGEAAEGPADEGPIDKP